MDELFEALGGCLLSAILIGFFIGLIICVTKLVVIVLTAITFWKIIGIILACIIGLIMIIMLILYIIHLFTYTGYKWNKNKED